MNFIFFLLECRHRTFSSMTITLHYTAAGGQFESRRPFPRQCLSFASVRKSLPSTGRHLLLQPDVSNRVNKKLTKYCSSDLADQLTFKNLAG